MNSTPRTPNRAGARRGTPSRLVALVAFEGVQLLDVAGPADVFAMGNRFATEHAYDVVVVSSHGSLVSTRGGPRIDTVPLKEVDASRVHTLLVAGGEAPGLRLAIADRQLATWVQDAAAHAHRYGSVCTGSFALAHWGLLEQKKATTHWSVAHVMERQFGAVEVDPSALFVNDGRSWTSGGVTSGIDMCLAIVEEDLGRFVAARAAKELVLSARRIGNQSQFSIVLATQSGRYGVLVDWIRKNLKQGLTIDQLSEASGESARTFQRRFRAETGRTPAEFVEDVRMQAARAMLEAGASVKVAARQGGFTSEEHLARIFRKRLDMTPSQYRMLHGRRDADGSAAERSGDSTHFAG